VTIPPSEANVPLTEEQIKDLTMMASPCEWPVPNLLAMKRTKRNEHMMVTDFEAGTLVYANMVQRYVFWPGLSFHMSATQIQKHMVEHESTGPLLAFQLEDLVREGWEVD
jgi:hypothetical protein